MSPRACLVITALDCSSLQTSVHGVFQRFRSIVEAYQRLGYRIRIAVPVSQALNDAALLAFEATVESEIARQWGFDVEVTAFLTRPFPAMPRRLLQLLGALRHAWSSGSFPLGGGTARKIVSAGNRATVIVAHRLDTMPLALSVASGQPIVLDLDDIEHRKIGRALRLSGSRFDFLVAWLSVRSLRRAERMACQNASTTLVCSDDDAVYLRRQFGGRVISIPNAVEVPPLPRTSVGRCILLMVGIYSYGPNADAAEYFIRDVFPSIRSKVPTAEAWFVGRGCGPLEASLGVIQGVKFLGFQQDLSPLYAESRLAICPIRKGGGTRIKIIEAAAYGVPCVSTTLGAEGLALVDGSSILIGDDAEAFAAHCVRLLNDPAGAKALGEAAHSIAQALYSRQAQLEKLVSVLGN